MSISTLKSYLRLILENEIENQAQDLIEENEAENLAKSELERPVSEIIKSISEKDLFEFIEPYPLKAAGVKSELQKVLSKIRLAQFSINGSLSSCAFDILFSLEKIEKDGQIFFLRGDFDDRLNDYISTCLEVVGSLDLLEKKVKDDVGSSFSDTTSRNAPLGKIVFPSLRANVPLEKNTAIETTLQSAIYGHIVNNKSLKGKDAQLIKTLVSGNFYPRWFGEPSARTVYRGMCVTKSYIAKILKGDPDKDQVGNRGEVLLSWDFSPTGETSSWSIDRTVSECEYTGAGDDGNYGLLLIAKVSQNPGKFVDITRLYDIEAFSGFANDQEVIGIGDIRVNRIKWWIHE
jgi:hypothetical protein